MAADSRTYLQQAETYAVKNSSPESPLLRDVRRATAAELRYDDMLSGPLVGALLRMTAGLTAARFVLEIGTFTGYGTLQIASGMTSGGRIITCEANDKYSAIARRFFDRFHKEQPSGPRIELLTGMALNAIREQNILETGPKPDLIFLDADKESYPVYYDVLMPVLRPGGVMVIDNAFWGGKVWADAAGEADDRKGKAVDRMNRLISVDARVENVLLPVRDGLQIVRKHPETS